MTDSYQEILQRAATKVWELRTEHERASEELRVATDRRDRIATQLREVEAQLCQSVGANIRSRMWIVRTGTAVVVQFRENVTLVNVLEAEPQA